MGSGAKPHRFHTRTICRVVSTGVIQAFPSGGMVSNVASDKRRMRCPESQLTPHPPLRGPKLAKSVCFSHRRRLSLRRDAYLPRQMRPRPTGRCWFYPPPPFQGPSGRPVPTVSRASIQSHATSVGRGFISRRRNDVRIVRYTAGAYLPRQMRPHPTVVVSNCIYPSVLGVAV